MNAKTTSRLQSMYPNISFSPSLTRHLNESINVIQKAIQIYKNPHCAICFNGGKDATVLFDLVQRVASSPDVNAFYLMNNEDFDEILQFVNKSENFWNFKLMRLHTTSLKSGLSTLIENYDIQAVYLGVRNSDFKKPIEDEFEPTTEGWPKAMRVMPILKWTYSEIWEYIEKVRIPVCSLYENGYTSIGTRFDTFPNPNLFDKETGSYKHAKFLENDDDERKGRKRL